MKIVKQLLLVLIAIMVMVPFSVNALVEVEKPEVNKEPVKVYLFYGNGCPHCEGAIEWFSSIEEEYGDYFELVKYEVWYDKENNSFMQKLSNFRKDNASGVPYIIVGDYAYPNGFDGSQVVDTETGKTSGDIMIERILRNYTSDNRYDAIEAYNNRPNYDNVVIISSAVVIVGGIVVAIVARKQNS